MSEMIMTEKENIVAIADAVRSKTGSSDEMTLGEIAESVMSISGSEDGNASIDITAEIGQTIRVKAIDENGKPTEWEAADYQKKICGEEETVILPETTVEIDPEIGGATLPELALEEGKEYAVNYNGSEYVSTCVDLEQGAGILAIGNIPLALETGDNGQPFVIIFDSETWVIAIIDGATSVTLSISEIKPVTIPPRYLPKGIGYDEWKVVFPETTLEPVQDALNIFCHSLPSFSFTLGETYRITYNGVSGIYTPYNIVSGALVGGIRLGNADVDGFTIEMFPGLTLPGTSLLSVYMEGDTSVTVTLKIEKMQPVTIPPKYLPEGIGYDDYLAIYEGTPVLDEDSNLVFTPSRPLVIGNTYKITYNGTTYTCEAVDAAILIANAAGNVMLGNYALASETGDSGEPFVMFYANLIDRVFVTPIDDITSVTLSISEIKPHKIASKYLPEGIPYRDVAEILPETVLSGEANEDGMVTFESPISEAFVKDATYFVNWNGVEYTCVGQELEGMIVLGNLDMIMESGDNGTPFIAYVDTGMLIAAAFDGSTELTLSIKHIQQHKLHKDLLPSDIGGGMPEVTASDEGAFLRVVNGQWAVAHVPNVEEGEF